MTAIRTESDLTEAMQEYVAYHYAANALTIMNCIGIPTASLIALANSGAVVPKEATEVQVNEGAMCLDDIMPHHEKCDLVREVYYDMVSASPYSSPKKPTDRVTKNLPDPECAAREWYPYDAPRNPT